MLAGAEVQVNASAFAAAQGAIAAGGDYVDVQLLPYEQVLIIQGKGTGNITVDLGQLPDSVINLQISSFESITLIGERTVNAAIFSNIEFVNAGRLSIGEMGLFTFGVEHIRIDAAPERIYLWGADGFGSVGEKTLLEVGRFSSSPTAGILAWVQNLGLATNSHVETVPQIASFPNQSILLNFQPDNPLRVTTEGSVNVIKGGDFVRYFLASASERAAQEQSHIVARQAATASVVSLESVLSATSIRAALTNPSESPNLAAAASLGHSEFLQGRSAILVSPVVDGKLAAPEVAANSASDRAPLQLLLALDPRVDAGAAANSAARSEAATAGEIAEFVMPSQPIARAFNSGAADATEPALPSLGESFNEVVADLRDQFASFGDLITAQVADHLRSDRQLALLVDARAGRTRDDFEVLNA